MKRAVCIVSLLWLVLSFFSLSAGAQTQPQIQVQIDGDTVGVGETVHLQISATSPDAMPTDPQVGATPGFVVRGQSASPSQTHISINGSRSDRFTLTVDWALEARRVGTFSVGPLSVAVGTTRFPTHAVTLHVVPAGQAPQRHAQGPSPSQIPFGFSPFDPWKGFFPGLGPNGQPESPSPPTTDPKLSLDAPRGTLYFLHATADKTGAVVGEQVTYSVYEYIDAGASNIEVDEEDVHDAQSADFLKRPLLREDQDAILVGYASVGGRTWVVKLVRRWALFPLRAGDLVVGPMSVGLLRPRSAAGSKRTTETLHVLVTEPPLAGRPPGYAPGDVGHFALSAQVQPREVEQGGAVGVEFELSGKGNMPGVLATPAQEGVEWLTPEVHDEVGPIGHESIGGKRRFSYVVRLNRAGNVDLGTLSLPFWDPEQKKYDVARARLGLVHVTGSAVAAGARPSSDASEEVLAGLPSARDTLAGGVPLRRHLDDSPLFWIAGVAAWPLAFGFAFVGRAAGRRTLLAWNNRRRSPAADLRERVAAAHAACATEDARTADAAIVRALEAAAVVHAGVSVRDAVGGAVATRLERAGVSAQAASSVAELLRECEAARFSPDDADVVTSRDRWLRAQGAIRSLERRA
jgi:hypothetical protein